MTKVGRLMERAWSGHLQSVCFRNIAFAIICVLPQCEHFHNIFASQMWQFQEHDCFCSMNMIKIKICIFV